MPAAEFSTREAWEELREFAELLQIPVMTTLPGKELLSGKPSPRLRVRRSVGNARGRPLFG